MIDVIGVPWLWAFLLLTAAAVVLTILRTRSARPRVIAMVPFLAAQAAAMASDAGRPALSTTALLALLLVVGLLAWRRPERPERTPRA